MTIINWSNIYGNEIFDHFISASTVTQTNNILRSKRNLNSKHRLMIFVRNIKTSKTSPHEIEEENRKWHV